ncbi:MAG: hypothetical protein OXC80_11365 [Gammaproteobacteria bacterium]|nr:hypothetical protein [Gammaproteobacteria bacterium]
MSDKSLSVKERWAQAIGVENARYERLTHAYTQLGHSAEEIEAMLQRLDNLENDPDATYPFTPHSAIYAYERQREESILKGDPLPELERGVNKGE